MAKDFTETQALSAALSALTLGEVVIVTGAQDGPFMLAAGEKITPGAVNLMATHARGLVEIALSPARAEELCLAPQPRRSWSARAEYAVSIEAAKGTSTGISATDRARTIQAASCGGPEDIVTPGHIIPRVCTPSEAGARQEAGTIALELLTKAGLSPIAAICTILDEQGEVATTPKAESLAAQFGLVLYPSCGAKERPKTAELSPALLE